MSRSTIRTRPVTSGKSRRKSWTLRTLTTVVLATGSLASLAGPAQAYDASMCERALGAGNVYDVDLVRIDTRQVDFGDLPHTGTNGAPQGDAVICWAPDGRTVAVVGRGFYESRVPGPAEVELEALPGGDREFHIDGNPGAVATSYIAWRDTFPGEVRQVRIKLKVPVFNQAGTFAGYQVVHSSDHPRGD